MFIAGLLSEAILYLCFSLLLGTFIISLLPKTAYPAIKIPKTALLAATLGIAIFSFFPVLKIILYLAEDFGIGYTLKSVLTNFEVGKSWLITGVLSLILFIYLLPVNIEKRPIFAFTGLIFTLILVAALGFSSHAASLSKWGGSIIHSAHFLAVSIWIGLLIVVSWFSQNHNNWLRFLKWFSPVAIICLIITALTGISLMTFHMKLTEYVNVTTISYGQTLLIKHLAIIPLLVFAFINAFLIRRRIHKDPSFNPRPWGRLESIVVLFIFSITGALGQVSPPHELERTIKSEGTSKLFSYFHPGEIDLPLIISPSFSAVSLFLAALLILAIMVIAFFKKAPKFIPLLMSLLFILTGYLAFMLSIK